MQTDSIADLAHLLVGGLWQILPRFPDHLISDTGVVVSVSRQ